MNNIRKVKTGAIPEANRRKHKEVKYTRMANLLINEIEYQVQYEPFFYNEQVRYYVCVNASPKYVFVWDGKEQFKAIDNSMGNLLPYLELTISTLLINQDLN